MSRFSPDSSSNLVGVENAEPDFLLFPSAGMARYWRTAKLQTLLIAYTMAPWLWDVPTVGVNLPIEPTNGPNLSTAVK